MMDVSELLKLVTQYGVLGIVCGVFVLLFRQAWGELNKANEARVALAEKNLDIIRDNTESMVRFTEALNDRNKSQDALTQVLATQANALDGLRLTVASQRDMDARFERLGDQLSESSGKK